MIILTHKRERELVNALLSEFTPETISSLVMDRMGFDWQDRSVARDHRSRVTEFLRWCSDERRLGDLLDTVITANPSSVVLRSLGEKLGRVSTNITREDISNGAIEPSRLPQWTETLHRTRNQVGVLRVTGEDIFLATAFLVGPSQVFSHAAALAAWGDPSPDIEFVTDIGLKSQRSYRVLADETVRLDCGVVLLTLAGTAGRDTAGALRSRGWIFSRAVASAAGAIAIFQYVEGNRLFVSVEGEGIIGKSEDKLLYSASTEKGSSGAPCFDQDWRLIAVHEGTHPPLGNQGVRIDVVEAELQRRGYEWTEVGIQRCHEEISRSTADMDKLLAEVVLTADPATPDEVWADGMRDAPADHWQAAEAASVVAYFDPEKLRVTDGRPTDNALAAILGESQSVRLKGAVWRFMLNDRVRERALERLASRGELRNLRELNKAHSDDVLDRSLGALIRGEHISDAQYQDADNVRALLQAATWLRNCGLALPDHTELHTALERAALIAPFRHLTRGFFAGRTAELEVLSSFASGPDKRIVFVHGPGGMGKSALIAHFVLQYTMPNTRRQDGWKPFIYLDFDRPELDARDLPGVLLAIARQIPSQVPSLREKAEALVSKWVQARRERHTEAKWGQQANRQSTLSAHIGEHRDLDAIHVEVAQLLREASEISRAPIVTVFDTLEEVQYAASDAVAPLIALVVALNEAVPGVRPIMAGRVRADLPPGSLELELGPLVPEFSEALLANELPPPLANNRDLISKLVDVVGGNPLSLRLAAQAVTRGMDQKIGSIGTAKFWEEVGDAVVQGQLYERIAGHIHEEDVRKLAVPGLILRFITADLIRHVLAKPCGVRVESDDDAVRLYERLASEVALVLQDGGRRLCLRPELRRTVLNNLREDRGSDRKRRQIHKAAVKFFVGLKGAENRAEEIYHRLWLNESPKQIDARWVDGIDRLLRDAAEELKGRSRFYLISRLGGDDGALPASASTFEWEGYVERRVSDLLRLGASAEALNLLAHRTERLPNSRLHLMESIALRSLPNPDLQGAKRAAEQAVRASRAGGDQSEVQGALQELSQVQRALDDTPGMLRTLEELGQLGEKLGDDLVVLQSGVEGLEAASSQHEAPDALASIAAQVFHRLPDYAIVGAPELSRRLAAQVGTGSPEVLRRVARLVGFGSVDAEEAANLLGVLSMWSQRAPEIAAFVPSSTAGTGEITSAARYLLTTRSLDDVAASGISAWLTSVGHRQARTPVAEFLDDGFKEWRSGNDKVMH